MAVPKQGLFFYPKTVFLSLLFEEKTINKEYAERKIVLAALATSSES